MADVFKNSSSADIGLYLRGTKDSESNIGGLAFPQTFLVPVEDQSMMNHRSERSEPTGS